MEDTKPLITENQEYQYRYETLKTAIFWKSDLQYPNTINKNDKISIENVSETKLILIDATLEKMNL